MKNITFTIMTQIILLIFKNIFFSRVLQKSQINEIIY